MIQSPTLPGSNDLFSNLSAEEKALVQSLLHQIFSPSSQSETAPAADSTALDLTLATLIADSGMDVEAVSDNLVDQMLHEHSDETLIGLLRDQVATGQTVIQTLAQRSIGRSSAETLSQLDLQLIALQISVDDLDDERQQQSAEVVRPKRDQLKRLLLKEFRFINNWARRL